MVSIVIVAIEFDMLCRDQKSGSPSQSEPLQLFELDFLADASSEKMYKASPNKKSTQGKLVAKQRSERNGERNHELDVENEKSMSEAF